MLFPEGVDTRPRKVFYVLLGLYYFGSSCESVGEIMGMASTEWLQIKGKGFFCG